MLELCKGCSARLPDRSPGHWAPWIHFIMLSYCRRVSYISSYLGDWYPPIQPPVQRLLSLIVFAIFRRRSRGSCANKFMKKRRSRDIANCQLGKCSLFKAALIFCASQIYEVTARGPEDWRSENGLLFVVATTASVLSARRGNGRWGNAPSREVLFHTTGSECLHCMQ